MQKKIVFFFILLSISVFSLAQKKNNQIEMNPFVRWDNYPGFTYHFNGRASTDNLTMKGTNYGINLSYKYNFKKNLFLKVGLGYFKYNFDKLDNTNSSFGKSQSRPINFISPLFIQYSTDKYQYNNLVINTGIEKKFDLTKGASFITSFNLNAYYTCSQYYHLTFNPNDGNLDFKKNEKQIFGLSGNIMVSITKQFGRFQIGPSMVLPIFDLWKKDPVFLEEDYHGGKSKWLNGIGFGIVCNISLHKKNKL